MIGDRAGNCRIGTGHYSSSSIPCGKVSCGGKIWQKRSSTWRVDTPNAPRGMSLWFTPHYGRANGPADWFGPYRGPRQTTSRSKVLFWRRPILDARTALGADVKLMDKLRHLLMLDTRYEELVGTTARRVHHRRPARWGDPLRLTMGIEVRWGDFPRQC